MFIDIHEDMIFFSQLRLMFQYILHGISFSKLKKINSQDRVGKSHTFKNQAHKLTFTILVQKMYFYYIKHYICLN